MSNTPKNGRTAWLAALFLLAAGLAPAARAQDVEGDLQKVRSEMAKTKREIQRADGELRRTDSLMRDEDLRASQAEERAAKDRDRRDKEIAALQARLKDSQSKIDAERNALARHQNSMDEIKSREKQAAKLLSGWCDSLALRVESGLPWDNQARLDRIRAVKRDLEAGSATPEEGLGRLTAILKEEVKAGDEIAVFNKPITRLNGESLNAQILRLGNQYLAYMDEEGKRFGIMERQGGKWAWREDLSFGEKNRLREAIEVKTAKRPPSLVILDLGLSTAAKAGNAANPTEGAAK